MYRTGSTSNDTLSTSSGEAPGAGKSSRGNETADDNGSRSAYSSVANVRQQSVIGSRVRSHRGPNFESQDMARISGSCRENGFKDKDPRAGRTVRRRHELGDFVPLSCLVRREACNTAISLKRWSCQPLADRADVHAHVRAVLLSADLGRHSLFSTFAPPQSEQRQS